MSDWVKLSLSAEQVNAFKQCVTCNAPYSSRVSCVYSIALRDKLYREAPDILRELDILEGILPPFADKKTKHSSTKKAERFKHPPLHPFWHKHFYT
jgi:hypothetical protein